MLVKHQAQLGSPESPPHAVDILSTRHTGGGVLDELGAGDIILSSGSSGYGGVKVWKVCRAPLEANRQSRFGHDNFLSAVCIELWSRC